MRRYDKAGRDVTDLPGVWSEDDCEIMATNYRHPNITTGQHTNGRADIWVRVLIGQNREWLKTSDRHLHQALECWVAHGVDGFLPF